MLFELKKPLYDEYDAYFIGLQNQDHFAAKERWLKHRQQTRKSRDDRRYHRPTAPKPVDPVPFYKPVLQMFVAPEYVCMMAALLRKAVSAARVRKAGPKAASALPKEELLSASLWTSSLRAAALHALSISCHILSMVNESDGVMGGEGKGSLSDRGSIVNFLSAIRLRSVDQQLTFPLKVLDGSVLDSVVKYVRSLHAEGIGVKEIQSGGEE